MQDAISNGNKYTAKEYAEAIDFMKRSYESYEEVFEDYHGVLSPSSPGVAPKGLKSTGTCLLYTSPSPRDISGSRMPSSA